MLTLRKLTPDLLDRLRPLADASLAGEEVLLRIGRSGFSLGYVPLPRAAWRTFPLLPGADPAVLLQDPSACVYLAFEDEAFIGQAAAQADPATGWTTILDIRVDAAHRRTGVARSLLRCVEDFSRQQHMQGLRISVTDTNPAACQFCEHCGFVLQGMDRLALAYTPQERDKPLARRACLLTFYQQHQKG